MFSIYQDKKSTAPKTISIDNYIRGVQEGIWQDYVLPARAEFQKNGKSKKYTFIKAQSPVITGSCIMNEGSKEASNIASLNGFLVIDIDEDITEQQYYAVKEDKYTHLLHKSVSGVNYCNFIKIDKNKDFKAIFDSVCEYYWKNFNIHIDQSCSNKNRLRFVSYDPDLYFNSSSVIYRSTIKRKDPKKTELNYVFTQSDFDNILGQIKDRGIDLCKDDYYRFTRVGMSLANHFGESGRDAFHFICSFGTKYNREKEDKTYTGFVRRSSGKSTISTFYYLCKQEGIEVYTEKTRTIINRVKVSKSQGKPTIESIKSNLKTANDIEVTKDDEKLIKELIESKIDFSKNANVDLSEIEQLENFIVETFSPCVDVINNITYINEGARLTDRETNNIYLSCLKNFDFNINKSDIQSVLNSNASKEKNNIRIFLSENKDTPSGYIDKYIDCIHPTSDYNRWAFRKWIVGALHNWTSPEEEVLVCPLTLVLSGQQHGTGKTSFLRNIMPKELRKYIAEAKINGSDKDSMYTLCSSLLVFDDEFGGKAMKDVKEYKAISDVNIITQRRPYGRELETFKRRAILCGTTNEVDVLKDVTGNRRILPIKVESVDYETITTMDTTKMIIEAHNLLRDGFDWMIRTADDIEYLNRNTEENNEVLPVEEMFFEFFSLKEGGKFMGERIMNHGEILNFMLNRTKIKVTRYDIKDVFIKNKIEYKNYRNFDGHQKKGARLYIDLSKDKNYQNEVPF